MTDRILELLSRVALVGLRRKKPDLARARSPRKVRVLHVIREGRGRPARLLQLLLRHLDRERFESVVVASGLEHPEFLDELRRLDLLVHPLDLHPSFHARRDFDAAYRVMTILRGGRFDVAHFHGHKAALIGRPAARVASTRAVVHTPHGFPFVYESSARLARLHAGLERAFARFTDALICASETETQAALRLALVAPSRVHTIPDGVEIDDRLPRAAGPEMRRRLDLAPGTRLVLMCGRLDAPKDPGTLLRAARHVLQVKPRVRFLLVGDGEMVDFCRDLARQLGIAPKVLCTGYRADAARIAAVASVHVLSAREGGPSLSLLESMALGKVVVASDIPGCREIITHGKTGVLFPPGDERILAGAILKVIGDPALASRLGRAAANYVRKNHDILSWTRAVQNVYLHALAQSSKKH
jgi:glycosyltransferase involved in cell wall biosynthesis